MKGRHTLGALPKSGTTDPSYGIPYGVGTQALASKSSFGTKTGALKSGALTGGYVAPALAAKAQGTVASKPTKQGPRDLIDAANAGAVLAKRQGQIAKSQSPYEGPTSFLGDIAGGTTRTSMSIPKPPDGGTPLSVPDIFKNLSPTRPPTVSRPNPDILARRSAPARRKGY